MITTIIGTLAMICLPFWAALYLVAYIFLLAELVLILEIIAAAFIFTLLIGLLLSIFGLFKLRKIKKEQKLREKIKKELQTD